LHKYNYDSLFESLTELLVKYILWVSNRKLRFEKLIPIKSRKGVQPNN